MKRINRQLCLAVAMIATSGGAYAAAGHLSKPKSMEELWEIIQAQQKQIDQLTQKREIEAKTKTTESPKVADLDHKTSVLAQEVEKMILMALV